MSLAVVATALFSSSVVLAADAAKPAADQPAATAPKAAPADAAPAASVGKPASAESAKPATDAKKSSAKPATQSKPNEAAKATAGASESDASKSKAKAKKPKVKPIDINNASAEELKKIPGVGDAEAERIIKARPYPTRAYLVERNVVTLEQYYAMKDYMVAVQPDPIASKSSKAAKK
jgi:DNA uptake protein ComE-like DNA-binding protein